MFNRKAPQTLAQLVAGYYQSPTSRGQILHNSQTTRAIMERKIAQNQEDNLLYFTWCTLRDECFTLEESCKNRKMHLEKLSADHDNFMRSIIDWLQLEDPGLVPYLPRAS